MENSYLDLNLDQAKDLVLLETGSEVEVQIANVEVKQSDKGNKYLNVRLVVIGQGDNVDDIYHRLMFPSGGTTDEDKRKDNKWRLALRDFARAFDIAVEGGGFSLEACRGKTAYAVVTIREDETYGSKNAIKSWSGVSGA